HGLFRHLPGHREEYVRALGEERKRRRVLMRGQALQEPAGSAGFQSAGNKSLNTTAGSRRSRFEAAHHRVRFFADFPLCLPLKVSSAMPDLSSSPKPSSTMRSNCFFVTAAS